MGEAVPKEFTYGKHAHGQDEMWFAKVFSEF